MIISRYILALVLGVNVCSYNTIASSSELATVESPQTLTIITHGVWVPVISPLLYKMDCPAGLRPLTEIEQSSLFFQAGLALHTADAANFPLASLYTFGWSGILSFSAREKAAHALYTSIKSLVKADHAK